MKLLGKFKATTLVVLGSIFFLSASLSSCGDGKKEAASEDSATEEVMEEEMPMEGDSMEEEMPMEDEMDSTMHEEEEHSEHPEGGEHPTEEGSEHPGM